MPSIFLKTEGIVLKELPLKENDSFFVLFTKDFGKLEVLAKGIKKPESKLCGHLNQFSISDFAIVKGRNFYQLAGSVISQNFSNLNNNFFGLFLLSYCLEVINFLTDYEQREHLLYQELSDILVFFSKENIEDKINEKSFLSYCGMASCFNYRLLCLLGYKPELDHCVICKNEPNDFYFNFSGGIVCEKCFKFSDKKISMEMIKILKFAEKNDLTQFLQIKISKQKIFELLNLIFLYSEAQMGRELRIKKWMKCFAC